MSQSRFEWGLRWRKLDLQSADMQEKMKKRLALNFKDNVGLIIA